MAFVEEFQLTGSDGPQKIFVFDDGLVVTELSRVASAGPVVGVAFGVAVGVQSGEVVAGAAFGGVAGVAGAAVGEVSRRRQSRAIAKAVSAMPDPSAEAMAPQVKRARLFRIDEVTQVKLEKHRGATRKIVVATKDGREADFQFEILQQPESPVRDVLSTVFGDRFKEAVLGAS